MVVDEEVGEGQEVVVDEEAAVEGQSLWEMKKLQ